jgi:hypothetical protein
LGTDGLAISWRDYLALNSIFQATPIFSHEIYKCNFEKKAQYDTTFKQSVLFLKYWTYLNSFQEQTHEPLLREHQGQRKKEGFYIDTRITEKIDFAKENLQILRRQVIVKIFKIHFFHSNLTPG